MSEAVTITAAQAFRSAGESLAAAGIEDPRLEAEILLRHVIGWSRSQFYTLWDHSISADDASEFDRLIGRRLLGEPTAYITGHKEFYGLDFRVTSDTLIPRPETELLVETALKLASGRITLTIADVGTGCGAVAIALAKHLPQAQAYALDISDAALEIAASNCRRHAVADRVRLLKSDLLEALAAPVDLIIANLPYISDAEMPSLSVEVRRFEPSLALAGGSDGLREIRRLIIQAGDRLSPGGAMLLEVGTAQSPTVVHFSTRHFPDAAVGVLRDLSGIDRVVMIRTQPQRVATGAANAL